MFHGTHPHWSRERATYDLVTYGASGKACYGQHWTTVGRGPGYVNSCIHSGTIKASGDLPTSWYNYVLASAGTIHNIDETDSTGTTADATESICPKGWTLPDRTKINSISAPTSTGGSATYVPVFTPVMGGYYNNSTLTTESTMGYWWTTRSSTVESASFTRQMLDYYGSTLRNGKAMTRYQGFYIRCVQSS